MKLLISDKNATRRIVGIVSLVHISFFDGNTMRIRRWIANSTCKPPEKKYNASANLKFDYKNRYWTLFTWPTKIAIGASSLGIKLVGRKLKIVVTESNPRSAHIWKAQMTPNLRQKVSIIAQERLTYELCRACDLWMVRSARRQMTHPLEKIWGSIHAQVEEIDNCTTNSMKSARSRLRCMIVLEV